VRDQAESDEGLGALPQLVLLAAKAGRGGQNRFDHLYGIDMFRRFT